jgi:hypothetical protein
MTTVTNYSGVYIFIDARDFVDSLLSHTVGKIEKGLNGKHTYVFYYTM